MARIIYHRAEPLHLYFVCRRTSFWLVVFQIICLCVAWLSNMLVVDEHLWWILLVATQLAAAIFLLITSRNNLVNIKPKAVSLNVSDKDLPSITVAIPARNETNDLEDCLISLLGSDYPKLEILVLDDSSQNRQTPEIIKSFAHEGVRFLAGSQPPDHWLAKNFAYQELANEASGKIILFCGVDTRFSESTITNIIKAMMKGELDMMCVVPANSYDERSKLANLFYQPSRYAWELALPRDTLERPAALSTCWLISRDALNAAGGLGAVRQSVLPEKYFAKYSKYSGHGYRIVRADAHLDLRSSKSLEEQKSTAIRTRYPLLHKRPELVSIVSLAEFVCLSLPYVFVIMGLVERNWLTFGLSLATSAIQTAIYSKFVNLTYRKNLKLGLAAMPLASLCDIALLNYSMLQYEFGSVYWKGRNITIPVMHVPSGQPVTAQK